MPAPEGLPCPQPAGGDADYFYPHPNTVVYKVPAGLPDEVVAGANCALSQVVCGLDRAKLGFDASIVILGAGGLVCTARRWPRRAARARSSSSTAYQIGRSLPRPSAPMR